MDSIKPNATNAALLIDEMILDYLVCLTTSNILKEGAARTAGQGAQNSEELLGLFDLFFRLFKAKYPKNEPSPDLRVKLQLLTFANIFLRRHQASQYLPSRETLQRQRAKSTERATSWLLRGGLSVCGGVDIPWMESPPCQDCGEAQLHPSLFSKHETSDIQDQVSLLDVLPEYLALGALVPREIAGHWMGNAVRLMLHSALEQVFVYKKGALKDLIQAFAWDWEGPNVDPDEFDQWKSLRDSTRSSFIGSGASPVANLKQLSLKNPVREFEEHILDQLKQLLGILPAPALKTLESRTLPGLTKAQMTAFSSRIGLY